MLQVAADCQGGEHDGHYYRAAKQVTKRVVRSAVRQVKQAVRVVKTAARAVVRKSVSGARATAKFVQHHAGAIVSTVVSAAVFVGCEAAIGVATGGVGAVAGAMACGALAGAVGGAMGHLADAAAGNTQFSWKGLAMSAGVGALAGFAGGALGGALGGVGGALASRLGGTAAGRVMSAAGGRLGGSAVGRGGAALGRGMDAVMAPARAAGTRLGAGARSMMRGGGDDVGRGGARAAADDAGGSLGRSCLRPHSFAPSTRVVMADGGSKPIGEVKLGERVLATDAATGKTEAKAVVALHHNADTDLADVTVRVPAPRASAKGKPVVRVGAVAVPAPMTGGVQARAPNARVAAAVAGSAVAGSAVAGSVAGTVTVTVHTTWHHPFWNQTRGSWTDAADLMAGDRLHALGSSDAVVVAVRTWTGSATMNDLTVEGLHTYYVVTADTPVLVHNVDKPNPCEGAADSARTLDIGGGQFPNTGVRSTVRTPEGAVSVNPEMAHGPTVAARSQQLPFADSVFDRVTMNHFPSDQFGGGTLSEVARVTRSGGSLSPTTGRRADVGGIVSELNRLGYSTSVGRAEGGIPWIEGVLGQ